MGSSQSNSVTSNQEIVNEVLQVSNQTCTYSCTNTLNGTTVIIIGGSGDINITQECIMSGLNCILSTSLDTNISDILSSMLDQSASAQSGFSLDWSSINQDVDLNQYIENSITQIMNSACTFQTTNTATGNYFYVENHNGDFNLSQSSSITNSNCNMDNQAKSVTYNSATANTDQESQVTSAFGQMITAIVICMVLASIVIIVFLLTGGTTAVLAAHSTSPPAPVPGPAPAPAPVPTSTSAETTTIPNNSTINTSAALTQLLSNPELTQTGLNYLSSSEEAALLI